MAESVQESQESAVQRSKESVQKSLAAMLEDEFKRVVATESISMAELVKDVAQSIHYTERHIYNWRCGKWKIPAQVLPALCRRFKSRGLIVVLESEMAGTPVLEMSGESDFCEMAISLLRQESDLVRMLVVQHLRPEPDRITLTECGESSERIIRRHRLLRAILEDKYQCARSGRRNGAR